MTKRNQMFDRIDALLKEMDKYAVGDGWIDAVVMEAAATIRSLRAQVAAAEGNLPESARAKRL